MPDCISAAGRAHLTWALTDGVGPLLFARLVEQFGDAERALGVPASQLTCVKGIGRDTAERIASSRDANRAAREIEAAEMHGVRIVCRADPDYPALLQRIADPPVVLYVKGELRPTDGVALAIVGSRKCSIYGSEQARRFGELFAQAGFTVVSGLARGIDSFAHHGAIEAGGRSIAVFGNGLGEVYPPENRALAEKLLEHGAWISEFPIQAAVRATNFPGRNRIIAGLTLGTLVVEAAARSGALITARHAIEANREVFAIPGRLQDPMSIGVNALIRDGSAKLVTGLDDVLNELGEVGVSVRKGLRPLDTSAANSANPAGNTDEERPALAAAAALFEPDADNGAAKRAPVLSRAEQRVYDVIGYEPVLQDIVLAAAELPPGEILAAFTTLELKGMVKRLPGQLITRRGTA
jgi:DNA processing protein